MCGDGTNPSLPQAIPNGMDGIDVLLKVVIFGVSPRCPRVVSWEGLRSPSEGIPGGCFWKHSESTFPGFEQPKRKLLSNAHKHKV